MYLAAAIRNLQGAGNVIVSHTATASGSYGFDWTVTFTELVGSRVLLGVSDNAIDGNTASLTATRSAFGNLPFGKFFSVSYRKSQ